VVGRPHELQGALKERQGQVKLSGDPVAIRQVVHARERVGVVGPQLGLVRVARLHEQINRLLGVAQVEQCQAEPVLQVGHQQRVADRFPFQVRRRLDQSLGQHRLQRQQLLGGVRVALLDGGQDSRRSRFCCVPLDLRAQDEVASALRTDHPLRTRGCLGPSQG
jgi:hypothetical protein